MNYNRSARGVLIAAFSVVLLLLCIFRLSNLQIVNGDNLRKVSEDKLNMTITIKAPRGNILDRYGETLAGNKMCYNLQIQKTDLGKTEFAETLYKMYKLVGGFIDFSDNLPISSEEPFSFTFITDSNGSAEKKLDKWFDKYNLNEDMNANQTIEKLCEIYGINNNYSSVEKRILAGLIYDMKLRGFSLYNPYTLQEDISAEAIAIIKENSDSLPGVTVVESSVRYYPDGELCAHLLGNVGVIYQEEYEKLKDENYSMDATIGKQGIELSYEKYLKGNDGIKGFEQTLSGLSDVITAKPAEQGNNVFLTIDKNVQKVMESTLESTINLISSGYAPDCNSGSAVCIDVNNGEIIAMASYPAYVPSEYNKKYNELIKNPGNPVWNRAIGGAYEPGSTFKMLTAIASLEEGIVSPNELILDNGVYRYYKDYQPQCMEWKYGKTHGYVDVRKALQESCNYYFFDVGRRLGIEKLNEYQKKFGFGTKTGIEINGEVSGQIASPENKKNRGENWNPGDTLQASIGQSDNLFTPIQLASYVATIANGGTRYQPHLVKYVKSADDGSLLEEKKPVVLDKLDISESTMKAVKEGMQKVTEEGTASNVFKDFPIKVAGKTGTAEVSKGSNNGIFVAFAPYDNPQIAIAIVIEHGTGGYLAAPVAKAVFEEYFKTSDFEDLLTVKTLLK